MPRLHGNMCNANDSALQLHASPAPTLIPHLAPRTTVCATVGALGGSGWAKG